MGINIENSVLYLVTIGGPIVLLSLTIYHFFKTRHAERLKLIEKGKEFPPFSWSDVFTSSVIMKLGLYLIGFSFGMISGVLLVKLLPMLTKDEAIAWGITIPFFMGVSLLVSNLFDRNRKL